MILHSAILVGLIGSFLFAKAQNPVAYFTMDGGANDSSMYVNDGTIHGGVFPVEDRFGNPCGALQFNGSDGYISVPNSPSLSSITRELTLCFWFKLSASDVRNGVRNLTVLCKGNDASEGVCTPQYRFQLFQFPGQSTISINTELTEYDPQFQRHLLPLDMWDFMATTYDGRIVKVYLNGSLIWQIPFRGTFCPNNAPLHIGRDMPGSDEYFSGALDDVMLFDKALSLAQLDEIKTQKDKLRLQQVICPKDTVIIVNGSDCNAEILFPMPFIPSYCGAELMEQRLGPTLGTRVGVGRYQIALAAPQGSKGKSCLFTVRVVDNIPPVLLCPADMYVEAAGDTVLEFAQPTASDNCAIQSIELINGMESGSHFPLGVTEVQYRAMDLSGNTAACQFQVTVGERPKTITQVVVDSTGMGSSTDLSTEVISIQHTLRVPNCLITLHLFDDQKEDNDTISFYFNDQLLVDREMIRNKQNGVISRIIELEAGVPHKLVSKAWNVGLISPNTLTLEIYAGDISGNSTAVDQGELIARKVIHSKPGQAGGIILMCD